MDLVNLVKEQLNSPDILARLGQTVGAAPEQVRQLTELGLPALLGGMSDNSQTPEGAEALASALDQHQDDAVDDVGGFLGQVDRTDGNKILSHVLGGEQGRVESSLARKTGLDAGQVSGLLSQLAPLVMGALGRQKKAEGLDAGGLASLLPKLGDLLGGGGACGLSSLLGKLDADGDGNFLDDVSGLLGQFRSR